MEQKFGGKKLAISIAAVVVAFGIYKIISLFVLTNLDPTWKTVVGELIFMLVAFGAGLFTKRLYVMKWSSKGFGTGMWLSFFITFTAVISLIPWFEELSNGTQSITLGAGKIIIYTISMLFLGIAEELLFRGILLNAFLDFFGEKSVAAIRWAIIWSSLAFGALHIFNIAAGASVTGTIVQVINAACSGILWGAAYVRANKNIWPFIIIHAFSDWCGFVAGGAFMGVSTTSTISSYSLAPLIITAVTLAIGIFEMRNKKLQPLTEAE